MMRKSPGWIALAFLAAASAAGGAASRPAAIIPLHGKVDEFLIESFHKRVRAALQPDKSKIVVDIEGKGKLKLDVTRQQVKVILLDLHTANGTLASALQLADAIHHLVDERSVETVALVHEPGSPATTLLALACDTLFVAKDAKLVPLDPATFDAPQPKGGKEKLLAALDRYSRRRPRLKLFFHALVDPALDVQAVEFEGREGQTLFLTTEDFRKRLAAKEEPVASSIRVARAGSLPTLDAAKAEQVGVSSATLATIGAVATRLNIAGRDLRTLKQAKVPGKGPGAAAEEGEEGEKEHEPPPIPPTGPIVVIPLSGMVGDGWEHSIKRRLREAKELKAALLIFEIDTYGGKLMSAFEISNTLFDLREPRTVVFINRKAISAGAFIAVAAHEIIMRRGSTFGDCQVVGGQDGKAIRSEKLDTVLRADFRKYCRGKYPTALAEAMVMEDYEVYECVTHDGKTEYVKGQDFENLTATELERYKTTKKIIDGRTLLTMTDTEAKKYGFSKASVRDLDEVLEHYGVAGREVVTLPMTWSESFVRTLDVVGPILLTLGILGIIIELKTPGFGVFGLVGLGLITVFFLGKHAAGLAETWEILLFFAGVLLLAIEIFVIPGFGILGVAGLVCMVASILLSLQKFVVPTKPIEWQQFNWNMTQLGLVALSVFVGILLISKYLHRAPYLGKLILAQPPPSTAPTAVTRSVSPPPPPEQEAERAGALVGKRGQALTLLRPAGRAEFDGEPLDVVTVGDYVQPGEPVEICEVHGNRVVVRRAT